MKQNGSAETLRLTDSWFRHHGLTYFVPEERVAVRAAMRPRRMVRVGLVVVIVAVAAGVALAWVTGDVGTGPALLLTLGGAAAGWYALTAMRFRPILVWAMGRTFGSLHRLLPMALRALPLLLLFMTFLFINAEVWEMSANLHPGALWLVTLLFGGSAVAFLLVRLPEEVDRIDDDVDAAFLLRTCARTPLETACAELVAEARDDGSTDPAEYAQVTGFERWNLVLALLVIQATQVVLIALAVFAFFLVFGAIVMTDGVQLGWTGQQSLHNLSWLPNVSAELVKVALFLSAFSALYVTVSTVTDETYRKQFFGTVLREIERAVGMRAVYLALRARESAQVRSQ
ncbi:hypothetical protein SAMN05428985_106475 [Nocardioides sp. YR527]|uniref:hypothetical protein n=1 Tax=Nocardioides sp. YR527 TaxID=1881028 RepID=UPI0008890B8A|nr:hypothetical protein [Nocardioides sp. YR527]SDK87395.1 hypothetical protein SAMN05428985_106475 [Nocardioides sp. YR527]